jgi:DNA-binding CsgD family transcriptional regulator
MGTGAWIVIGGVEPALWSYSLEPGRKTLGRNATCDIPVPHPTVSRIHAEIEAAGPGFRIRDLASCNGTYVNDQRITAADFNVGDTLRLGAVLIQVVSAAALPTVPDVALKDHTTLLLPAALPSGATPPSFGFPDLSPAQQQVVQLLLRGLSEKEVAARLHLSSHTVHVHTKNIYRALDVHSRAELLTRYLTSGTREQASVG